MARIELGSALGDHESVHLVIHGASLRLTGRSNRQAIYTDKHGNEVVFSGHGFGYDGASLVSGRIERARFLDRDGGELLDVQHLSASARNIEGAFAHSAWSLLDFLSPGDNVFIGTDGGDDMVTGRNPGNDIVRAGAGDDWVKATAGDNRYDGGAGFDHLWYTETYFQQARRGLVLDVEKGTVLNSWGGRDRITGFEEYRGSRFDDRMLGGTGDDILHGMGGDDVLDGRGGYDVLRYRSDAEFGGKRGIVADFAKGTVRDGFGSVDRFTHVEEVSGTARADRFVGDGGDNVFVGFEGRDRYDGAEGIDAIKFLHWSTGRRGASVDLSLDAGQVIDDGYGNRETARNIEALSGSQLTDRLALGSADGGWAFGNGGDDVLIAGSGKRQWLGGGAGADVFEFRAETHLDIGSDRDVIDDFNAGQGDLINLAWLGNTSFVGTAAFGGNAAELRYDVLDGASLLQGDINGDGIADIELWLNGVDRLDPTDFLHG